MDEWDFLYGDSGERKNLRKILRIKTIVVSKINTEVHRKLLCVEKSKIQNKRKNHRPCNRLCHIFDSS